jgi:hypothetical protein
MTKRKEWQLWTNYGQGFEHEISEDSASEMKLRVAEYRENCPSCTLKVKKVFVDRADNPPQDPATYYCFTRTWWKRNPAWPDGREPEAGKRHTVAKNLTFSAAQAYCQQWNSTHKPGPLSRKCEFDEQRR